MSENSFHKDLLENFPYTPTADQERLLRAVSKFTFSQRPNCLLLVRGYAGTGKTTVVGAITKALENIKYKSVLLAPTGRAAKVMANYSGHLALTIHKKIYRKKTGRGGVVSFEKAPNLHTNTVFFVDEASMISSSGGLADGSSLTYRDLLDDLMSYVFSGKNCRLILIGDTAQLPPVGIDESPALNLEYLKNSFSVTAAQIELTEVLRQSHDSGILENATYLRDAIRNNPNEFPHLKVGGFSDIVRLAGDELEEELQTAYNEFGDRGTMVITRSNKRANLFNQQIRNRLLWREEDLAVGDMLMVVRNNYFWLDDEQSKMASFIANGDIAEIKKIIKFEELYDFQFAEVEIELIDYPDMPPLEAKILIDTISTEGAHMPQERMKAFYHDVAEDYVELGAREKIHKAVMEDPFYNALQVKFSYAITCHKAQGGQWPVVFVDQGFVNEEMMGKEYLRWLYTAVTRASEKLYLLNFDKAFFGE
ncbi:ATP-dependent DNA helicase [Halocola ammonii]